VARAGHPAVGSVKDDLHRVSSPHASSSDRSRATPPRWMHTTRRCSPGSRLTPRPTREARDLPHPSRLRRAGSRCRIPPDIVVKAS
jgi:hypothetical protein